MKKLLTLLFALTALFSFAQDAAPDSTAVRLNSPSFYYSPGDSALRMYKSYVYGWTKLAPQRNVDNLAAWAGTVKSIGITVPTGLSVTGTPVTVSGTIGIGLASGYSIPSTSDRSTWTSKEPAIAIGSTLQFWRGDKSWQALNPAYVGLSNVTNNAQWYSGNHPTTISGYGITDTPWTGMGYLISGGALGTPSSGALTNCTFPTLNQSTTGSAATLTTPRTIAGASFNGSANIALANKFIVQGTSDAGLSGPQFLGALATGILKNTTTTGVLSIAANSDLPAMSSTVGGAVPTPPNDATKFLSGAGTFLTPASGLAGTGTLGYLPYWSTATNLIKSPLFSDGTNIGVGTSTLTHLVEIVGANNNPVQIKGSSGGGVIIGDGFGSSPASGGLWSSLNAAGTALTPTSSNFSLRILPLGELTLNVPASTYGINLCSGGVSWLGMTNLGGFYVGANLSAYDNNTSLPNGSMVVQNTLGIGLGVVGAAGSLPVLPTAKLHIAGGTATAGTAPLKINSGTLTTTPEAGAIENNGTALYYTNSAGSRTQLGNAVTLPNNHQQVSSVASLAGSATEIDLTGITATYTPVGSHALILFSTGVSSTNASLTNVSFMINIAGTDKNVQMIQSMTGNPVSVLSMNYMTAVTAGVSTTIKMRWQSSTLTNCADNNLTIIDLP